MAILIIFILLALGAGFYFAFKKSLLFKSPGAAIPHDSTKLEALAKSEEEKAIKMEKDLKVLKKIDDARKRQRAVRDELNKLENLK